MKNPLDMVILAVLGTAGLALLAWPTAAQETTVTAQIEVVSGRLAKKGVGAANNSANFVVWLTPADGRALPKPSNNERQLPTIVQQNKSFTPHITAVQVGSLIQFPNRDRFLHNVFSLHDGKQFDLGFYEAGSAKTVRFDRPGVSFLFCNIHPEMTAAVIAVETPYFGISDSTGRVTINGVAE